jgi:hypothetical protein
MSRSVLSCRVTGDHHWLSTAAHGWYRCWLCRTVGCCETCFQEAGLKLPSWVVPMVCQKHDPFRIAQPPPRPP